MNLHPIMNPNVQIDWTDCRLVERVPDRMSNVPILKGTRVQADSIVENFWGGSPVEEISENFFIPESTIRELLQFAEGKENHGAVKVVFDHNVPHKLRRFLPGHYIQNAAEMDWAALSNGFLLNACEREGFDVMVTCDQGIYYQQNLKERTLALVVLTTNNWNRIKPYAREILTAIDKSLPGGFSIVRTG